LGVSAGYLHTVGLRADGTGVAVGSNRGGQCDVSAWLEITAIPAGSHHTVGLRADGTLVAAGWNGFGRCDVRGWRDRGDRGRVRSHPRPAVRWQRCGRGRQPVQPVRDGGWRGVRIRGWARDCPRGAARGHGRDLRDEALDSSGVAITRVDAGDPVDTDCDRIAGRHPG